MIRLFQDHNGKPSMVRVCAFLLTLTTVYAVGVKCETGVISALVVGGVVALLVRSKQP